MLLSLYPSSGVVRKLVNTALQGTRRRSIVCANECGERKVVKAAVGQCRALCTTWAMASFLFASVADQRIVVKQRLLARATKVRFLKVSESTIQNVTGKSQGGNQPGWPLRRDQEPSALSYVSLHYQVSLSCVSDIYAFPILRSDQIGGPVPTPTRVERHINPTLPPRLCLASSKYVSYSADHPWRPQA